MYDTILVPVDGSEHSVRAAQHSIELAGQFDATVHLLHVVDVQTAAGPFDAGGVGQEFVSRLETEGQEVLEEVTDAVDGTDVSIPTALVRGRPSEAILDHAAEHDADLIVMGTHGRTGVGRHILGSVAERTVRLADRPVLTVRATEQE